MLLQRIFRNEVLLDLSGRQGMARYDRGQENERKNDE
jgi:hypothetical protein